MRKIFLDCGGYNADSVDAFKKSKWYSPDVIIYSFEPNPRFKETYKKRPDINFIGKAVWVKNEEQSFYIAQIRVERGSSIIKGKRGGHLDQEHPIKVQCLDFSKWILDNFTKDDFIVLKMDIEGAEYPVLNKMIEDGSIYYIKKAFIAFHSWLIRIDKKEHMALMKKLEAIKGLELLPEMEKYLLQSNKRDNIFVL